MNDADIESILYRIFAKKIVFFYKNERYELQSSNIDLKYNAQLLYDNIINDEKFNDWIRQEYLDNLLINLGLWNTETFKVLKNIYSKQKHICSSVRKILRYRQTHKQAG